MSMMSPSGGSVGQGKISGYKQAQLPNMTPQMMQLFQSLLSGIQPGVNSSVNQLNQLASGNEEAFGQIEAPAYEAFNRSLGQIGSRFSGLGARNSSGFENATYGAGADLAQKLQSQRFGIQQQSQNSLLGLSQNLLGQQPYQNFLMPKDRDTGGQDIMALIGKLAPSLLALL